MTVKELTREDVEFKTLDGLTLRGWLYPAAQRGPAMIMSPGVCTSDNDCSTPPPNHLRTNAWLVQYAKGSSSARSCEVVPGKWYQLSSILEALVPATENQGMM
jgi:hypothetical protein